MKKRIKAHQKGSASKYTRSRRPVRVVFSKKTGSKSKALREEARIKHLSRGKKLAILKKKGGLMKQWNEVQIKARKMIDDGLKLLRSGMNEAEFLAEATASAAKLHVTLHRNRLDKYRALHDIGLEVFNTLEKDLEAKTIYITPSIEEKIDRVREMDDESSRTERQISKLSVSKKEKRPPTSDLGDTK